MPTEIKVPALGESVTEATVAKWLKKIGDAVKVDDPLVELETDKVTLEVNATADGTLAGITVAEGDTVAVGGVLGTIGEAGGKAAAKPAPAKAPVAEKPVEKPAAAPVAKATAAATASSSASAAVVERSGPAVQRLVADAQRDADRWGRGSLRDTTATRRAGRLR